MSRRRTLRNRITESDLTFVVSLLITIVLWLAGHWTDASYWGGMAMIATAGYITLEMNNRGHLLRVRSRMMSSSFMLMLSALPIVHDYTPLMWVPLCVLWANLLLFSAYQQREPVGRTFYAFVLMGTAMCVYPPLVLMLLPMWFCLYHNLRILSWRTWSASVFGLCVAPIYMIAFRLWTGADPLPVEWMQYVERIMMPAEWTLSVQLSIGLVALMAAWGTLHFRSNSYKENLRTRMLFGVLRMEMMIVPILLLLWREDWQVVLLLGVATGAPFVAHYFALAEGRWHNRACWLLVLLLLALGLANHLYLV